METRVGIDLASSESIRESIREHGSHYLERVYTEGELRDCRADEGVDPLRLAARFAAKEATLKVLRPTDDAIPWRAIEVLRDPGGWVELRLSGAAAALAEAAGLTDFSVSLTHEGEMAAAVVIASCPRAIGGGP
jgi:holo-[acyl-carrier protein] synthase